MTGHLETTHPIDKALARRDQEALARGLDAAKHLPGLRRQLIDGVAEIARVDRFFAVELAEALRRAGDGRSGRPAALTPEQARQCIEDSRRRFNATTDEQAARKFADVLIESRLVGLERFDDDADAVADYIIKTARRKSET